MFREMQKREEKSVDVSNPKYTKNLHRCVPAHATILSLLKLVLKKKAPFFLRLIKTMKATCTIYPLVLVQRR